MPQLKQPVLKRLVSYLRVWQVDCATWIIHRLSPTSFEVSDIPTIVFSPHQDDETLGCGGLIALKRERDIPVKVVFLTNGDAYLGDHDDRFAQMRQAEALAALKLVGVEASAVSFWDYPDGLLGQLSSEQQVKMQQDVMQLLVDDPVVEIYVPHRADRHADHEATYTIVRRALDQLAQPHRLCQYPIWIFWKTPLFWRLKLDQLKGWKRLNIQTVMSKKQAAIAAHESQIESLPPGFLKRFLRPEELFY